MLHIREISGAPYSIIGESASHQSAHSAQSAQHLEESSSNFVALPGTNMAQMSSSSIHEASQAESHSASQASRSITGVSTPFFEV